MWFLPQGAVTAMGLRVQTYEGRDVLTWYEGTVLGPYGGDFVVYDPTYHEVARVKAGRGRHGDLHEFLLTPQKTALISIYYQNTSAIVEGIVQELELPSGRVLFEWRSLDHVAIDESHAEITTKGAYDYFHINSIELDADGNFLVSARNTWGIYKIDRGSGEVIWRLGGKRSDFAMGPGTGFAWQHDARHHGARDQLISLFDDGAAPQVQPHSKALVLALDTKRMRATLHKRYISQPAGAGARTRQHPSAPKRQRARRLGHGAVALPEYTHDGELVFDAHLPKGGQNYRVLKMPWRGHPTAAGDRGPATPRPSLRLRELERRDRHHALADPHRQAPEPHDGGGDTSPPRLRDGDDDAGDGRLPVRRGRRRVRAAARRGRADRGLEAGADRRGDRARESATSTRRSDGVSICTSGSCRYDGAHWRASKSA